MNVISDASGDQLSEAASIVAIVRELDPSTLNSKMWLPSVAARRPAGTTEMNAVSLRPEPETGIAARPTVPPANVPAVPLAVTEPLGVPKDTASLRGFPRRSRTDA